MKKVTQKQLIEQIKGLKEIKPRKEWALLLKSQILTNKQAEVKFVQEPVKSVGIMDVFHSLFFQKKMAYAFAVILFLIVGTFSLFRLYAPEKVPSQTASLMGQKGIQSSVATLNTRINNLAQVTKGGSKSNLPLAISEVKTNVSELVKNLKENPVSDQKTLKEIASSLKTLADVPGTDITSNPEVQDLYQTVVQSQITDLQKTTLTDDQKKTLTEVEDLYKEGKYADALEKILLINN